MMELEFLRLKVVDIEEDLANNPRLEFEADALEDLADSIKKQGLLQPILVRRNPDRGGKYIVISGARRYKAVKFHLHRDEIDACITRSLEDEAERFIAQVQENEQRAALNGEELKAAVMRLHTVYGFSNTAIAEKLGKKSANFVSRILSAAKPGMNRFLEMCNGSTENLSEIAKFKLADREILLTHFERSGRPFSQSDLRKITLMQRSGVEIADMDVGEVIALTRDEIVKSTDKRLASSSGSKNFSAGMPASGKYAEDKESDFDTFESELRLALNADKSAVSSNAEHSAVSAVAAVGKYALDDSETNDFDPLAGADVLALQLDPKIDMNVRLTFTRFAQALILMQDDLHPDQIFELPVSVTASRARELIALLGGDGSVDQEHLATELSRRLAHPS